jgi:tetratricopeptide (TPR) repeat protein
MPDLRLLSDLWTEAGARQIFERLVTRCVRLKNPSACSVRPNPGDKGVDTFVGELTGLPKVWQAKYFLKLERSQQSQVTESWKTCTQAHPGLTEWTLCLPIELTHEEHEWWQDWKKKQTAQFPRCSINLWEKTSFDEFSEEPSLKRFFSYLFRQDVSLESILKSLDVRIFRMAQRPNPNFTGREELLTALRAALTEQGRGALVQAVAGLGGIGKTQLANEYAWRHKNDYDIIWWMDASTPAVLATQYSSLAADLNLPQAQTTDLRVKIEAVRHRLEQMSNWLLIFDNAEAIEDLSYRQELDSATPIEMIPRSDVGHVLITSRDTHAWDAIAQPFNVDVLIEDEAVELLNRRSKLRDVADVRRLAGTLGCFPLALEQAGAYIRQTELGSYSEYLELFEERQNQWELLQEGISGYELTVATTWDLSVAKLSPRSNGLLNLCSYLAPDKIPIGMLLKEASTVPSILSGCAGQSKQLYDALRQLIRYSLVKHGGDKTISVHRLVQQVVRLKLSFESEPVVSCDPFRSWSDAAMEVMEDAFVFDTDDLNTWSQCSVLLPHAESVLSTTEGSTKIMENVARYLRVCMGEKKRPEELLLEHLRILENCASTRFDPRMLQPVSDLAMLYRQLGQHDKARPLFERALTILDLNPDIGPNRGLLLNNLALLHKDLLNYTEAEELYKQSLVINTETFGADHPTTASTMHNLGALYQAKAQYELAESYYEQALDILERALGQSHPGIASTLSDLGVLYHTVGKLDKAESLQRRSLTIKERTLGEQHPDIALSLNLLGHCLVSGGKHIEAKKLFLRALEISELSLGLENRQTCSIMTDLVNIYRLGRDIPEAEALCDRLLETTNRVFEPTHPEMFGPLCAKAELLLLSGSNDDSMSFWLRALKVASTAEGGKQSCFIPLVKVGTICIQKGDTEKAESYFLRAMKTAEESGLDEEKLPGVIAIAVSALVQLYAEQRKFSKAVRVYEKFIALKKSVVGPGDISLAHDTSNLAYLLHLCGRLTESERMFEDAISIIENIHGPNHQMLVPVLEDYAKSLQSRGRRKEATELEQHAARIKGADEGWETTLTVPYIDRPGVKHED